MKTFLPIFLICLTSRLLAADGGTLTLREALGLATSKSPELAGFSYDQRAADARLLQAGPGFVAGRREKTSGRARRSRSARFR